MHKQVIACAGMVALASTLAAATEVGDKAPEINAAQWHNAKGTVTLEKLRGQIVLIDYWATWCGPCKCIHPQLVELHQRLSKKGVVLIGLSHEPDEKVGPFIKNDQTPYIIGSGSTSGKDYAIKGYPTFIVVDPRGKVTYNGYSFYDAEESIEKVMKETPPMAAGELAEVAAAADVKLANGLLAKKKYAEAINCLETIVKDYGETPSGKKAKTRLDQIKKDNANMAEIRDAEARSKCSGWLQMAHRLKGDGDSEGARRYYRRVIDEFGDSGYANTARKELADLK